uniref:Uncharacterized protein n=1 Tax=Cyclophora tenuis TaxID=216820 RepID=A0A7S1D3M1_CYCTE
MVNMGGLGIADRTKLSYDEIDEDSAQDEYDAWIRESSQQNVSTTFVPTLDSSNSSAMPLGWAGQGLSGNHSSNSLNKSTSGLFIDGEETDQPTGDTTATTSTSSTAASTTLPPSIPSPNAVRETKSDRYIKTTNMARFYYRKTNSFEALRQTKSHEQLLPQSTPNDNNNKNNSINGVNGIGSKPSNGSVDVVKRKSKSSMNLSSHTTP